MINVCPVCGYDKLYEPPYDNYGLGSYEICPCCGFQFGVDDFSTDDNFDVNFIYEKWRKNWEFNGKKWFSKSRHK